MSFPFSFAACFTPALNPYSNLSITADSIPPTNPTLLDSVFIPAIYPTKNEFSLSANVIPKRFSILSGFALSIIA